MASVFLLLLFSGLAVGDMLCVCVKGKMGKQGVYEGTVSSDIWLRGNRRFNFYAALSDECRACVCRGNDKRYIIGIFYRSGNGKDVPCQVLGLQQAAPEPEWSYLCHVVACLGVFFSHPYIIRTYAGGTLCAEYEYKCFGGVGVCAHGLYFH